LTAATASEALTAGLPELAQRLADRQALCDLEACPLAWVRTDGEPQAWLDTRPLVDARLHAPEVLAMNADSLRWARLRGLVVNAPAALRRPWLVKVNAYPVAA
jgi:hypothetical protein